MARRVDRTVDSAEIRPPLPPFTLDTAIEKVRAAEDGWNNENWEFDEQGLMMARHASINDLPIREHDRNFRWPLGRRPDDHPGLSSFGF
jgi:hypothetical protein